MFIQIVVHLDLKNISANYAISEVAQRRALSAVMFVIFGFTTFVSEPSKLLHFLKTPVWYGFAKGEAAQAVLTVFNYLFPIFTIITTSFFL